MEPAMNTRPGFHAVDTASAAYSAALMRAHDLAQRRCLREEMIEKFWLANYDASHTEFERFIRELDAAETQRVRAGLAKQNP
jgi:hypothetical protein